MIKQKLDFSQILALDLQDIKSSLSVMLSSLEVINDSVQDEKQQNAHTSLCYEVARINGELFQLQTLHKYAQGDLVPQIDGYYVMDIFEEQLANCDMLFRSRKIEVELDCDPDLRGYFDAELIGGLVYKSLVNCSRYSRKHIKLSAWINEAGLLIRLADDSPGYPQFIINASSSRVLPEQFSGTALDSFCSQIIALSHHREGERGHLSLSNGGELGGGVLDICLP
ncbi:MAG: sensor histidine kinase [Cellvibrionaceae bacterium]|nr:sensor histidine kinase [Cellvibrionaceae bacterium]